jgi:hypothetical protein
LIKKHFSFHFHAEYEFNERFRLKVAIHIRVRFACHFANDDGKQQKINAIYKQFVLLTFATFVKKNLQLTKLTNIFMKRIFVRFVNCAIVIVIC